MKEQNSAKCDWYFPDTYLNDTSDGVSHEAVCVLNIGEKDATISMKFFFEQREPMEGFTAVCKANRTNHIRFDRLKNGRGEGRNGRMRRMGAGSRGDRLRREFYRKSGQRDPLFSMPEGPIAPGPRREGAAGCNFPGL